MVDKPGLQLQTSSCNKDGCQAASQFGEAVVEMEMIILERI